MGVIRADILLREPAGDARMQIDGRLHSLLDVQVKNARCAARRKRTDAAKHDSERGDGNITGHQRRDRRAACLVDLADEHQRQMHLLRLDEPQPSTITAECLDDALLLGGDRRPRRIGEVDGSKQPH